MLHVDDEEGCSHAYDYKCRILFTVVDFCKAALCVIEAASLVVTGSDS